LESDLVGLKMSLEVEISVARSDGIAAPAGLSESVDVEERRQ
jgi:hypothetical protein